MTGESNPRLAKAASPYLRGAAHQPVAWYAWGPEAFAEAKRLDRPILLDVGAVWCHWCHVMDGESYDDPEVAKVINDLFIAVKVDRDERPDVDARYQRLVGSLTGQGGWPLTGFLTPDGRVFYGGTYFPPRDAHGRPSFRKVLEAVSHAYEKRRDQVLEQADHVTSHASQSPTVSPMEGDVDVETAAAAWDSHLDVVNGGWGRAPKFPHPSGTEVLLALQRVRPSPERAKVLTRALQGMADGGIHDQLGGGFHRYSVDERWHVPHFEKMLYDNAELLRSYVQGADVLGEAAFAEVAAGIVRFMDEVLSDRNQGGFFGSQDADVTFGDDGDYFTWTPDEAQVAIGDERLARVLALRMGVEARGPMHHHPAKNVLHVVASFDALATTLGRPEAQVRADVAQGLERLRLARSKRKAPFVDPTLYTNWNAMAIRAYLDHGAVLGSEKSGAFAIKTLDRFLRDAWDPQRGFTHTLGGSVRGLLDDHAQMLPALCAAFTRTQHNVYLVAARHVATLLQTEFWDEKAQGFLDVAKTLHQRDGGAALNMPQRPTQDSPSPSANGRAVEGLLMLAQLTGEDSWRMLAERALKGLAAEALDHGLFGAQILLACHQAQNPGPLVVVAATTAAQTKPFRDAALRAGGPRVGVIVVASALSSPAVPPEAKAFAAGPARTRPGALVCLGQRCLAPVWTPRDLEAQLRANRA